MTHLPLFCLQVNELHQLYRVQISMMEEFKQKDLENYNLHKRGMSPVTVNLNDELKCSMVSSNFEAVFYTVSLRLAGSVTFPFSVFGPLVHLLLEGCGWVISMCCWCGGVCGSLSTNRR